MADDVGWGAITLADGLAHLLVQLGWKMAFGLCQELVDGLAATSTGEECLDGILDAVMVLGSVLRPEGDEVGGHLVERPLAVNGGQAHDLGGRENVIPTPSLQWLTVIATG